MATATLRCYAELSDFLPAARRGRDIQVGFVAPAPVRHLIELCGVPHTEVELVLRNGESVGLEATVADGDRLAVYPVFESFDIRPLLRLRPRPLRRPRFLADAHLGALARRLRLLGFDTLWHNDLGDAELVRLAVAERRILLSRDRQLLMRQTVTHGCYIRPGPTRTQLAALLQRLQLCAEIAPFSRCTLCNAELEAIAVERVRTALPPDVAARHQEVWRCRGCGHLYWQGSHWRAMRKEIARLCSADGALALTTPGSSQPVGGDALLPAGQDPFP